MCIESGDSVEKQWRSRFQYTCMGSWDFFLHSPAWDPMQSGRRHACVECRAGGIGVTSLLLSCCNFLLQEPELGEQTDREAAERERQPAAITTRIRMAPPKVSPGQCAGHTTTQQQDGGVASQQVFTVAGKDDTLLQHPRIA